ncbi:MAG: hypothetical protein ABUL72_03340 [Armatimonadota bacterium]
MFVASLILAAAPAPDISSYLQPKLKDVSFVVKVGSSNQKELAKINKDFAQSYRFKQTNVFAKEPFKLRLEAQVEDQSIVFILNGASRWIRVPSAHISQKENLAKSPGKRQTWLDFGILTPGLFTGLYESKFVRNDRESGAAVFDLTYLPSLDDTTRQRVFIDPDKKVVSRREWYGQDGKLKAIFSYEAPIQKAGVWISSKLTVKNADGKVAGVSSYTDLKVNSGLSENLFKPD